MIKQSSKFSLVVTSILKFWSSWGKISIIGSFSEKPLSLNSLGSRFLSDSFTTIIWEINLDLLGLVVSWKGES